MSERWLQKLSLLDLLDPPADLEQRVRVGERSPTAVPARRRRKLPLAAGTLIAVAVAVAVTAIVLLRDSSLRTPARTIGYPEFAARNLPYQPGNGFPTPNGGGFSMIGPPKPPPPPQIRGASASSPTDAWAVGTFYRTYDRPASWHWDGSQWTAVHVDARPRAYADLNGVAAVRAGDAWAVGSTNTRDSTRTSGPLVMHRDGSRWRTVDLPFTRPGDLQAVSAANGQVWAAGSQTFGHRTVPLLLHLADGAWAQKKIPLLFSYDELLQVFAASDRDVWVTALRQRRHGRPPGTIIAHWDGRTWRRIPMPFGRLDPPSGFAATSFTDAWAVGSYADRYCTLRAHSRTIAAHWDGHRWQVTPTPVIAPDALLSGVAIEPDGGAVAIGAAGTATLGSNTCRWTPHSRFSISAKEPDLIFERWDGHRWSLTGRQRGAGYDAMFNVAGAATTGADWFVSGSLINHYEDGRWFHDPPPNP
jgi:hypothetical protein